MDKTLKKIIATLLIVSIAFSYLQVIGIYVSKVYATNSSLEEQNTTTNISNVEFDAFFKEEEKEVHTATKKISESNLIYAKINVKDAGYLKEGQIKIKGASNESANFSVLEVEDSICQSIEENTIKLNNIESGSEVVMEIPISFNQEEKMKLANFSTEDELELTGIYIDANGNERKISKTIKIQLNWEDEVEAEISQEITRYVPYQVESEKGVLLQTTVKTAIKDSKLPLKQSKVEVLVPTIGGETPSQIKVIANTLATNGVSRTLSEEEYTYNEETGMLEIITENKPEEDETISWKKQVEDEYIITCIFKSESLQLEAEEGINVNIASKAEIQVYGNDNTLNVEVPLTENVLKEKINDIVIANVTSTESLSKAFLYTNSKLSDADKKETEYEQTLAVNVSYTDLVDELKIGVNPDSYIYMDEQEHPSQNSTYIKELYLDRENYLDLLGEEGTITIETIEGNPITIIGKETEADNSGKIVVDIADMNIDQIVIKTSKPVKEGTINIHLSKAIKSTVDLPEADVYKKLKSNITVETLKDQMNILSQSVTSSTELVEPVSKIDFQLNTETLSTVVENKNIELKAILDTSNKNYALYTNPVIEFILPEYVESITVNSVEVKFNDELKVKTYEVVAPRTLRVTLSGEQTKYDLGLVARGANIIANINIVVKQLTPTKDSEIKMYVQNENSNLFETIEEGKGVKTVPVKFVAPVGLVAANSISNYNSQNDKLLLISGETQKGNLDILSSKTQLATVEHTLINNSNSPINNVNILGRIIAKGNTSLQTGEELGTTFDTVMKSGITVEGIENSLVTVYYSEKASATNNILDKANGWTTEATDLSKMKSYLIVLNNYEMPVGTVISLKYNIEIPGALSHNHYGYTNYAVYYNVVNSEIATVSDSQEILIAPLAEVTTGEGPELKVEISSNVGNNANVYEGQIIKYNVKVINTGKAVLEGVIAGADVPAGTTYIRYKTGTVDSSDEYEVDENKKTVTHTLGTIAVGESKSFEFEVRVNNLIEVSDSNPDENNPEVITEVKAKGYATAGELDGVVESENELVNSIQKGYITTSLVTTPGINETLDENSKLTYKLTIQNIREDLNNFTIKDVLPPRVIFSEAYYNLNMIKTFGEYNENTREVTYKIPNFKKNEKLEITLVISLDATNYGVSEIKNSMDISFEDANKEVKNIKTNEVINTVNIKKAELKSTLTTDIPQGNIEEGDAITYQLELTNTGTKDLQAISIMATFPSALQYVTSSYLINGVETQVGGASNDINLTANLPAGTSLRYSVTFKVKQLEEGADSIKVQGMFTIYNTIIGTITTDTLEHTIIPSQSSSNENPSNPNNPSGLKLKRIQGQVWIDSNKNGKKDEEEARVKDVEVMLFSYKEGNVIKDSNGNIIIQKTDENGNYQFSSLTQGDYAVIFLYDVANYSSTEYRKDGVETTVDSDIIDSKITLNGEERIAGLTEKISLTNANIYNIDAGIVEDEKFDLKLDKTVASITVQNETGTARYEYNNKFAKRDLTTAYLDNTTVIVEYKISIKNEGAIEGYAKKVVDYIPANFKFNAELNRDWFILNDGSVCSSSLANTKIQPGETKEITLLLTKTGIKDNDLKIISNTAEILEAYNDLGIEDVDSTPGNKQSNEDDTSVADVLLTIRTGAETASFIGLTIAIVAIIGTGVYFIDKKVLRRIR